MKRSGGAGAHGSATKKEKVDPRSVAKSSQQRAAAASRFPHYFYVYNANKNPHFILEGSVDTETAGGGKIGEHNPLEIVSFQSGALPVIAMRYIQREREFCQLRIGVRPSSLNTPGARDKIRNLTKELRAEAKVVLAHPFRKSFAGGQSEDRSVQKETLVIISATEEKAGQESSRDLSVTICPTATWSSWTNVVRVSKLYLAIDLDRTVVDSYTLDGLAKLVRTDSLDEKSKALALSHYNALGIFKESGEVPWFILAFYRSKNVSIEENGSIRVVAGKAGSELVFTKYQDGNPVLFWIRPGFRAFMDRVKDRYFPCFITQSSPMHASLALEVLKIDAEAMSADLRGAKLLTVCRRDRRLETKAFRLTGAGASQCFVGLDDLCGGSDELQQNLDGVSIWERSDLRATIKPVPYYPYSDEAGRSDAIPLEICSNLLEGLHERFFASLHRSVRESGTYGALMACPLATVEDIVS